MSPTLFRPGGHETQLRRYFGQHFDVPSSTIPITAPLNIMLFVNRSGSSMIAEYLRATEAFSGFGEPLNHEQVIKHCEELEIDSFTGYLDWLLANVRPQGTQFGLKASPAQALMLLRSGAIPHYFGNVRWIVVQRLDVLSQAISFCIANQTKQWHSFEPGNKTAPVYDFNTILTRIGFISSAYAESLALTSAYGISPYHLTYEQFLRDPLLETRNLSAYLGVDDVTVDTSNLLMQKQANKVNEEFRARFVADFQSSMSDTA